MALQKKIGGPTEKTGRGRSTINKRFASNMVRRRGRGLRGGLQGPGQGGFMNSQMPLPVIPPHYEANPNWKFPPEEGPPVSQNNAPFFPNNTPVPPNRGRYHWRGRGPKKKTDFIHIMPSLEMSFCMPNSTNVALGDNVGVITDPETKINSTPNTELKAATSVNDINVDAKENIIPSKNECKKLGEGCTSDQSGNAPNTQAAVKEVDAPTLVDAAEMEKETKKYYEEVMGTLPKSDKEIKEEKAKNKALQQKSEKPKPVDSHASWATMHEYWNFVQENPYDFNGWTKLLGHVEGMENIEAARSAFEGFLPLYPYCFAYWKKLSDFELKHSKLNICIGVLFCAIRSIPLCTEIWVPLIDHFMEYARQESLSDNLIRGFYELGLESMGLSWYGSLLWERCISFEIKKNDLRRVMALYRRVLKIPLKVYNKHWDSLVALVRDHPPQNLLSDEEYTHLRKLSCEEMKIVYTPLPADLASADNKVQKSAQPDDKLTTTIKEKIVAGLIRTYEKTDKEVNKRWKYEEKIKRPYFHIKPLEKKQIRVWNDYLDYELKQGDPVRTVILFERCLVSCAQYEEMWCKYAIFMEEHAVNVSRGKYIDVKYQPGYFSKASSTNDKNITKKDKTDSDIASTGEAKKDIIKNKNEIEKTDNETSEKIQKESSKNKSIDLCDDEPSPKTATLTVPSIMLDLEDEFELPLDIKNEVTTLVDKLREGIGVGGRVLVCPPLTATWILRGVKWEDVRQIYRRAAWIHCPSKPLILMQWAEFEESQENTQTARELLNTVIVKHPNLLRARLQLIELERRNGFLDRVEELYAAAFKAATTANARSFIAIRYARFLFKIKEEDEKALVVLRKALKKDKGNSHLFHHVFDICYQRRPVDGDGVLAAVLLALASKELSLQEKYWFCEKRSDFLKEHGTLLQLKEAKIELNEYRHRVEAMQAEEARISREKEKLKEEDDARKAALVENQKEKDKITKIPLPPGNVSVPKNGYSAVPPTFELDFHSYGYGRTDEKDVTGERMLYERYDDLLKKGYPDQKPHHIGQESYLPPPPIPSGILGESLFNQGRVSEQGMRPPPMMQIDIPPPFGGMGTPMGPPPQMPNMPNRPYGDSMVNMPQGKRPPFPTKLGPPPKMPCLDQPPPNMRPPLLNTPERPLAPNNFMNSLPPEVGSNLMTKLPEWFVSEGGEYRLSSTPNGDSVIRYWPRYMNENGHMTLFNSLRKSVKWYQPPREVPEPINKLMAWLGPCNYEKNGVFLKANTSWPPEIVDLLHRLIRFLKHDGDPFNSCLISLYVNGYSHQPWHTDEHAAMSVNPKIATISTGATRIFEMRRKDGSEFVRFPLFPGSLLVMDGATQRDWLHQISREPEVPIERISLSFRSMLMIKGITV